jgi:hypothetical protein
MYNYSKIICDLKKKHRLSSFNSDYAKSIVMHQDIHDAIKEYYADKYEFLCGKQTTGPIHSIYGLKVIINNSLPKYQYELVDQRFKNDNLVAWFSLHNPPVWAVNLGIVKEVPCIYLMK